MTAETKGLHGVMEKSLEEGVLLRERIRELLEHDGSRVTELRILMDWDVSQFVKNNLSRVEDLRKALTLTGSEQNVQAMSCKDYVAQTWGDSGLKVLDSLIESLREGHAEPNDSERRVGRFVDKEPHVIFNIFDHQTSDSKGYYVEITASGNLLVELMEQIAWLGSAFTYAQENSRHGPFQAMGYYQRSDSSRSPPTYILDTKLCPLQGDSCWFKFLQRATLAVGFPVRKRQEGEGLEIPFPLLKRIADTTITMDYDDGTIFVAESIVLYPARKLIDGIQWHIIDVTLGKEAFQVLNQSEWYQTRDIDHLTNSMAYLG
jgi:hypothetical protein